MEYKKLKCSANFSKLQFETRRDLKQYLEDNKQLFRFVSVSINWETLIIVF